MNALTSPVHIKCNNWVLIGTWVYCKIFHYKPWTSVLNELIYCLGRMNFEYLFYFTRRNFVSCITWWVDENDVVSPVIMEVFVCTEEYMNASASVTLQMLNLVITRYMFKRTRSLSNASLRSRPIIIKLIIKSETTRHLVSKNIALQLQWLLRLQWA